MQLSTSSSSTATAQLSITSCRAGTRVSLERYRQPGHRIEAMSGEVFELNPAVLMHGLTTITELDRVGAEPLSQVSLLQKLLHRCCRLVPERWAGWHAIPLRLIIGFGFIQHGYAKLARGADSFTQILRALGMPYAQLLSWLTIAVEILGGLAVLLGAFIPLASIPMAIVLVVAIVTVHWPNGYSSIKLLSVDAAGAHFGQPGYETDLLYLAGLVALVLGGSGPLALDSAIHAYQIR